jgi:hypothetical protein
MGDVSNYRVLGIVFVMVGVLIAISLGVAIGPAFIGTGLPLAVVGIVFLAKSGGNATEDGDS